MDWLGLIFELAHTNPGKTVIDFLRKTSPKISFLNQEKQELGDKTPPQNEENEGPILSQKGDYFSI